MWSYRKDLPSCSGLLEGNVKRTLVALALWVSWLACAWAEDPVYFADAKLKAAVEHALWTSDPTPSDMLGLTSLFAGEYPGDPGISDITGLEYATNLQTLRLPHNRIDDVSALSGLTALETLVLNNNRLSDLSPLSGLYNVRHLDVHDSEVTDIDALSGLRNLRTLILRDNQVSDIRPLSCLANLEYVDFLRSRIEDISPLLSLTGLQYLDLRGNPLSPEACTTYIPQIIANNPGIDLQHDRCSRHCVVLSSTVGGSITEPGEGEFTYDNGEMVCLLAEAEPGFVFDSFSGTYCTRANPALFTISQDQEIRANFVSVLDTVHVDADRPSDPGANGTREHPLGRIQEAIEVAREGVTIVVHAGTYHETIDLLGKHITLTGFDPNDHEVGAWPVLDGGGAGPVVSFTCGEDPNCRLAGFVITAGKGQLAGAMACSSSSPTIANCLIVGNQATDTTGGAVYCVNSHAALLNCTIAGNYGGSNGAGLYLVNSHVEVVNSILWGNGPCDIVCAGLGGALVSYSDVEGGWGGPGCIDTDPLFADAGRWAGAIWVMGDYHLQSQLGRWDFKAQTWVQDRATSPCIDGGDPSGVVGQEPSPNGGIVNIGAYGRTAEASKSRSRVD
jgi:hypothetical protein